MTMPNPTTVPRADGDQRVVLGSIGWRGYRRLLRLRGDQRVPRIIYLDGTAWLMSPALPHEHGVHRLGSFVTEVCVGLGIPFKPIGSTTLRRRRRRGGVEGDLAYYVAHESRVRGKSTIDLKVDPPPDLAIEVVNTHQADEAIEVYRRLGVPEVWVQDEARFRILCLGPNLRYAESPTSRAFPCLNAAEVADWVRHPEDQSETDWVAAVRAWVGASLKPRWAESRGGQP